MEKVLATAWKWVSFECHAPPGSEVFVGGTFNGWRPSRLDKLRDRRHDGTYRALLKVQEGRHEYNFQVNGEWLSNPQDSAHNSVMDVV